MKRAVYLATALSMLVPAAARAQQAAETPAAQADQTDQGSTGLQDIVVTAQKRSENLQNVPIAIVAASGDQLESRGITTTTQLNVLSPGLNFRVTAGSFQPFIRGVGTGSTVTESPVALYIDGVYLPQQREGTRELEDVEQIAVLKGPQGTLFGRNATGGVIQITTKAPSFELAGRFRAEIDNYATLRTGGYVTGPLSDTIAASLSGTFATQGNGWGKDFTTGNDTNKILHDVNVRGKVLFRLGPGTDVTLAGDYNDSRRYTFSNQPFPGTRFSFANPYTSNPNISVYDTFQGLDGYTDFHGGGGSLTVSHDAGSLKLVSITAYRDSVSAYLINNGAVPQNYQVSLTPNSPSRSFSQEFQIVSNGSGSLQYVLGLYYFWYKSGAQPIQRFFGGPLLNPVTQINQTLTYADEVTESVAPFGEAKWEFAPDTHLTLGGRYTYEQRDLKNSRVVSINTSSVSTTATFRKAISYSEPTIRVGLDHSFSNEILAYATYNTGFKSGGFNSVSPATPGYLPEKLKAYEAGLKTTLLDRRLRLNFAGFYYDYTNLQVTQFINNVQSVVNGPKARIYGLDVDLTAQVSSELQLSGGFELLSAKLTQFPGAVFASINPNGGATLFPGDASGKRLPLAQEFTGTLSVDYHHDFASGAFDANITANYNGDYYFQVDNLLRQGAYTTLNASATYTLPGDRISVKVFGRNLLNERVVSATNEQTIGFSTNFSFAPRTYGVGVGFKF